MAESDLTVFGDRTGNTKRLKTYTDSGSRLGSALYAFFKSDGTAYRICPDSVFKAYRLRLTYDSVTVNSLCKRDLFTFLNRFNTVLCEYAR